MSTSGSPEASGLVSLLRPRRRVVTYDVVVIGSGPGGAVTARECARRGLKVLVLEEGDRVEPGAVQPYSVTQMRRMYRDHGLTVALGGRRSPTPRRAASVGAARSTRASTTGRTPRSSRSGQHASTSRRCPRRTSTRGTRSWRSGCTSRAGHVRCRRRRRCCGAAPSSSAGPGSTCLDGQAPTTSGRPTLHTMQRTYLDDALEAGCDIRPQARVRRLEISAGAVRGVECDSGEAVRADRVVVSAGSGADPGVAAALGRRRTVSAAGCRSTPRSRSWPGSRSR